MENNINCICGHSSISHSIDTISIHGTMTRGNCSECSCAYYLPDYTLQENQDGK